MKGREKQRKNRKRKEEQLKMKNNMGILDPTPWQLPGRQERHH